MADGTKSMIFIILVICCQIYLALASSPYCDFNVCNATQYCCHYNKCCTDPNQCKNVICEPGTYCCDINKCCNDYSAIKLTIGLMGGFVGILAATYFFCKYPGIKAFLLRRRLEQSVPYSSCK